MDHLILIVQGKAKQMIVISALILTIQKKQIIVQIKFLYNPKKSKKADCEQEGLIKDMKLLINRNAFIKQFKSIPFLLKNLSKFSKSEKEIK